MAPRRSAVGMRRKVEKKTRHRWTICWFVSTIVFSSQPPVPSSLHRPSPTAALSAIADGSSIGHRRPAALLAIADGTSIGHRRPAALSAIADGVPACAGIDVAGTRNDRLGRGLSPDGSAAHTPELMPLHWLYLGIADGMSIARIWACRCSK